MHEPDCPISSRIRRFSSRRPPYYLSEASPPHPPSIPLMGVIHRARNTINVIPVKTGIQGRLPKQVDSGSAAGMTHWIGDQVKTLASSSASPVTPV